LELVLVTPLLMALFVLILYVGNFMVGQAYVVADARNSAWHKRYTEAASKEYDFQGAAGFVDAESTQERRISNLVESFPSPKSKSLIIGDAWHARANDPSSNATQRFTQLNRQWNSQLQIELAKLAGVDTIDQALNDIDALKNIGDRINDMILNQIGAQLGPLNELLNQFQSRANQYREELEAKREAEKQKLRERIDVLNTEIRQIKSDIQTQKDRVKAIDQQIEDSGKLDDDDDDKLTDDEIENLKAEKKKIEDVDIPQLERQLKARENERKLRTELLNQLS
jgi:hypothetical protein